MLPVMSELKYSGVVTRLAGLEKEFTVHGTQAPVGATRSAD